MFFKEEVFHIHSFVLLPFRKDESCVGKVHVIFLVTFHYWGVIRVGMKGQEGYEVGRGPSIHRTDPHDAMST